MSSAVGTRRSLLHDVLSQSEVVELGLDGSIDDLPPLVTRLIPSCARTVNAFCWCYFLYFWVAAAVVLRHVAVSHPDTLLPGLADIIFISVCTVILLCAECGVYFYVKGVNALPDNGGSMVMHFTPSSSCVIAHFALSATTRMCTFLDLLFLLHAFVLPTPMIMCAIFTVSLTSGALPFLLQLRSLIGYACGDGFDPLECTTCIPIASVDACISRCWRRSARLTVKGLRLVLGVVRATRCGVAHLAGICAVSVARRPASTTPGRQLSASCCVFGNDDRVSQTPGDCEGGTAAGPGSAGEVAPLEVARDSTSHTVYKEPLVSSAVCRIGTAEAVYAGNEGETESGMSTTYRTPSSDASTWLGWRGHPQEDGISVRSERNRTSDVSITSNRVTPSSSHGTQRDFEATNRDTWAYIPPRQALELANCLLFLDLPTLALHFKVNFLPLEQLEAHEFLTSLVSFVRLYSGDCCMLLYLIFGLCTYGANVLFILLMVFLLLKLKSSCFATVMAHIAAVFGLWDVD